MNRKDASKLYADEHVVRIIAAQVVVLTVIIMATQWQPLAWLLAVDFALRAFTYLPAPLAVTAKAIVRRAGWKPKPIFAAPKRFAAALGFVFSSGISVFLYFRLPVAACSVGAVLAACAVLESVFRICLGCYVFNLAVAPLANRKYNRQAKSLQ